MIQNKLVMTETMFFPTTIQVGFVLFPFPPCPESFLSTVLRLLLQPSFIHRLSLRSCFPVQVLCSLVALYVESLYIFGLHISFIPWFWRIHVCGYFPNGAQIYASAASHTP